MTELKDALKIGPDEGAVEYVERAEAILEQHLQETGERLTLWGTMPGETAGEVLERMKVLREADGIRSAARDRERGHTQPDQASQNKKKDMSDMSDAVAESSRLFRIKSQERDVERAASEFEAQKKRLYRADGTKVYGEAEHTERLGKLVEGLREKVEAVANEAAADAEGYEREVLALSYTDPTSQVSVSERSRLESARAFVKEDCETMAVAALAERVAAVSAGSDKVAKVLHARYGRMRLEALEAEANRLASEGRPGGPEAARERRGLAEAVSGLEESLRDPKAVEREQALKEAVTQSKSVLRAARSRLSGADGSDERSRREHAEMMRAAF